MNVAHLEPKHQVAFFEWLSKAPRTQEDIRAMVTQLSALSKAIQTRRHLQTIRLKCALFGLTSTI